MEGVKVKETKLKLERNVCLKLMMLNEIVSGALTFFNAISGA